MKNLFAHHITIQQDKKIICRDMSLHFYPGEICGILGQNGCGKTSLLHALIGLQPVQQGNIFIDKMNLSALPKKIMAQQIGILFQDYPVFLPQTVWEYCLGSRFPHLAYFQNERQEDKRCVNESLHLMELFSYRHRSVMALSGGEKRRLAIASLLSQSPFIYLLDEPTNHLDIRHQMRVMHHFRYLAKNFSATVVMVLHDIRLARAFCDRVVLMFSAEEWMQGKKEEVLTAENLTRLYQWPIVSMGEELFLFQSGKKEVA